ncbi:MAG: pyrroloquinoline quinone-dependent dehydrogenase, partial [Bryobacteraceae bacterium]
MKNLSSLILLGIFVPALVAAQSAKSSGRDWPVVNGAGAAHYSTLTQINRKNVKKLERAWQFDSGDQFEGSELECNPIILD